MTNTNNSKALAKLGYCQSIKHARAAVKALIAGGFEASTDRAGYIMCSEVSDRTKAISDAAIRGTK